MTKSLTIILCAWVACACVCPVFAAKVQPEGTVYTANGQKRGTLRWLNSAKEYRISDGKSETVIKADDAERVEVDRPASLNTAIRNVQAKKSLSTAIKDLEDLVKAYSHLTYDLEAARWLATAYLEQGNSTKAVSVCEGIIRDNPEAAYKGEMASAYWDALIKDGKGTKLNLLLEKAIASGDRAMAATALVKRGDAIMARGSSRANCEEALRDGYLRVILLYADPQLGAYPEALYKGAKAFDGMSQGSRADKLREQLKRDCASSHWATQR